MDASRLGLRDPRSPGGVMGDPQCTKEQEYMGVMKTASVKSSKKAMASSSRLPVWRECERLEGIVALDGGRTRVNIRVAWRPSGGWTVWVVWASNLPCR
jgi:hypothetical protein